ncbi:UNVERIFIED_CONTAM: hypothetical protein O8I53_10585 [Campylobacter lari]
MHLNNALLNYIDINQVIDYQASQKGILKDFAFVKSRYKSKSLMFLNNEYQTKMLGQLFENYDSDVNVLKSNHDYAKIRFYKLFSQTFYQNKKYQSIFKIDEFANLDTYLYVNKKYRLFNEHQLILLYLDFLINELKRSGVNTKELFVIVPHNATYQVIELLKFYDIKYYYYNQKNINNHINNDKCLLYYANGYFNTNPKYSKVFNNYYFLTSLI